MIGQHKRDINIIPYQSEWVELFKQDANILRQTLGEDALGVEHIGSTSVPDLAAKPVIDIMVAIESLPYAVKHIPELDARGYLYRSHDTVPERMFFAKEPIPEFRTHHLNLTELGSGFWVNQIAFRDYLRVHEDIAEAYVNLKLHLAEEYERTQVLDIDGKTAFVNRVLKLAKIETD